MNHWGKEVRAIFCDISKAFDRVWHKGLLFKLKSAGVAGSLLTWFSDYLTDRKQRVVLPGVNFLGLQLKLEFYKALFLDLSCFSYIFPICLIQKVTILAPK